ncbi:MAG: hypothetical protein RI826_04865 [Chlorobium phaeovibrioides]|nr:hypothetical protein [Chlorobium phaeovibrioides]
MLLKIRESGLPAGMMRMMRMTETQIKERDGCPAERISGGNTLVLAEKIGGAQLLIHRIYKKSINSLI